MRRSTHAFKRTRNEFPCQVRKSKRSDYNKFVAYKERKFSEPTPEEPKPDDSTEKVGDVKPSQEVVDKPEVPTNEDKQAANPSPEPNSDEMPAIEFSSSEDSVSYDVTNLSNKFLERTFTTIAQF